MCMSLFSGRRASRRGGVAFHLPSGHTRAEMGRAMGIIRNIVIVLLLALGMTLALGDAHAQVKPRLDRIQVSENVQSPAEIAAEDAVFAKAIAALAPQRAGQRDVYVLAAGLWDDHVFLNEARESAKVLASRFGAQERTLVLAQGAIAREAGLPTATPVQFNRALAAIGALMDRQEDVLVLFVTSHGAASQGAVFQETGRLQGVLSPGALAASLREVGPAYRIIIVSACFAGQYGAPLANAKSIILTASAPDRSSFGCQPERDWTWFGDAFLNVALRSKLPLLDAFEQARATVQGWEIRENQRPSKPGAFVGEEMKALLAQIEKPPQRPSN